MLGLLTDRGGFTQSRIETDALGLNRNSAVAACAASREEQALSARETAPLSPEQHCVGPRHWLVLPRQWPPTGGQPGRVRCARSDRPASDVPLLLPACNPAVRLR